MQVAGFHTLSLSGWGGDPGHAGWAMLAVLGSGYSTCDSKFVPEVTA